MRYWFVLIAVLACVVTSIEVKADAPTGIEFFESRIRPIFVEHCYSCHSSQAKRVEGALRLDSTAAIQKGGESGPIVIAGKPHESPLIHSVSYAPDTVNMPPKGKLNDRAIADLRQWVAIGAPLPPPTDETGQVAGPRKVVVDDKARQFWSFQPLVQHSTPAISAPAWPRRKHDWFVRHALDEKQIQPAPQADRRTLIRRLSFDLIGMPPTIDEVEAFVANESADAYSQLVERLLASPHYGERWARHWLDIARYAEDNPTNESTCKAPRFAFRYRDWVVKALNSDLPYDEFIRRQLAADLQSDLPQEELAATGFLGLSPVYHKEPKLSAEVVANIIADEWDERIDTITRGILGLTVACARCHDHKFDPIRSHDYYALAGVMASTRLVELPLVPTSPEVAALLQDTQEAIVDTELRLSYAKRMRETAKEANEATEPFEEPIRKLSDELKGLKERALFAGPIANAVRDSGLWIDGADPAWTALVFRPNQPRDLNVFVRGNPARPGDLVQRRFLEVLSRESPRPFVKGSGRLELANAMVHDAQGLTARVIVNRVWGWHFGQPIVRTPSNFGALGDAPSHPALLDDLAARFVAAGWSLKWLHREIVHSATYQQSTVHPASDTPRDPATIDGGNRLLWRMHRRRLESEVWRDSVLHVTRRLDETLAGPSSDLDDAKNVRRTLYGKISRQNVSDVLRLFDFPDAKQHAEERIPTTTPLQQLYLLNSSFMQQSATAVVTRVSHQGESPEFRLRALFRQILQREPTIAEQQAATRLVANASLESDEAWRLIAHGLLASNEFLYVD
jgi:cytochrome c553